MYYPVYPEATIGNQQIYLVTGLFKKTQDVENALRMLEEQNYGEDEIALAMTDETRGKSFSIEKHSKAAKNAAEFGTIGGVGGAIFAALMSVSATTSGGLSLVIAGPFLSALAGFGAGSLAGGFFGALIGAGIPEYEIDFYKDALESGNVLVAVKTKTAKEADLVKTIFEKNDVILTEEEWQMDDLARVNVKSGG